MKAKIFKIIHYIIGRNLLAGNAYNHWILEYIFLKMRLYAVTFNGVHCSGVYENVRMHVYIYQVYTYKYMYE